MGWDAMGWSEVRDKEVVRDGGEGDCDGGGGDGDQRIRGGGSSEKPAIH